MLLSVTSYHMEQEILLFVTFLVTVKYRALDACWNHACLHANFQL